jgi:hypothetical protein
MSREKIVVALYNGNFSINNEANFERRFVNLEDCVRATDAEASRGKYGSIGIIQSIFVAPEYYFAAEFAGRQGFGRGLPQSTYMEIIDRLIVLSKKFPRVLLIPGTIAWTEVLTDERLKQQANYIHRTEPMGLENKAIRHQNFNAMASYLRFNSERIVNVKDAFPSVNYKTPTLKEMERWWRSDPEKWAAVLSATGATLPQTKLLHQAMSWQKSRPWFGIKALHNATFAFLGGKEKFRYAKRSNFHETQGYEDKRALFLHGEASGTTTIEDLRIGFEICLDHNVGKLPETIRQSMAGELDIHLVLSDYVLNLGDGGGVLRIDGVRIHASTMLTQQGVWTKSSNGDLVGTPPFLVQLIDGHLLTHYIAEFEDNFSLNDTFMA